MREVREKVYTFSELGEKAKEYVHEKYGDIVFYDGWWDDVFEMFFEDVKEKYGVELTSDEITFSGFGYYTDGVSIEHIFSDDEISRLIDVLGIKFKHGLKNAFIDQLGPVKLNRVSSSCHRSSTHAYIEIYGDSRHDLINEYFEDKADELEKALEDWKDEMCITLFKALERENDERESDEFLMDFFDANGNEFYVNGAMYDGEFYHGWEVKEGE